MESKSCSLFSEHMLNEKEAWRGASSGDFYETVSAPKFGVTNFL
jgi:hypothetical protein